MKKHQFLIAVAITGMTLSSCGSSEEETTLDDALEQLGDSLDDAADDLEDAYEDMSDDMSDDMDSMTDVVDDMTADDNSEWLDEYEEVMDEYVDLLKQAQSNPSDMTIMQKSSALSMKVAKLGEEGGNLDLSVSEAARMAGIAAKMASAMQGL
ncbi:hypothetical protein N9O14_00765 [Crocinitomicaceae bacterium]|nr:hypothetical protein [Crocinitomicaceae bacterium]